MDVWLSSCMIIVYIPRVLSAVSCASIRRDRLRLERCAAEQLSEDKLACCARSDLIVVVWAEDLLVLE